MLETYVRHLARDVEQRLLAMSAPKSLLIEDDRGHEFGHRCEAVPEGSYPHAPSVRIDGSHAMLVILPPRDRVRTTISEKQREWELEMEEVGGRQVVHRFVVETETFKVLDVAKLNL